MQRLQGLGLPSIMSIEEFNAQVAWPGDQPSSSGEGGASTAQDHVTEEPITPAPSPTPTEEKTTIAQTPQPSPPAPEETQPSTLDINEDQPQEEQDV